MKISVTVNGTRYERDVEPRMLLAYFLREECGLTGTHVGCDSSSCGVCVVALDGFAAVKSCTMFAVQADGHEITTVEGLEQSGVLHPLQQAFWDQHGLQCGYCTPGMLMASYVMLKHNPKPGEAEIRAALAGNLCRCTGYNNIVKAVQQAAGASLDSARDDAAGARDDAAGARDDAAGARDDAGAQGDTEKSDAVAAGSAS